MSRCTCGEHIAELCAGAITTAERVRELTAATPAKGGIVTAIDITWLSTSAAAATVTNYNSAPLLRTLAGSEPADKRLIRPARWPGRCPAAPGHVNTRTRTRPSGWDRITRALPAPTWPAPAGTADADTQKTHRMGPRSAVIHPVPDLIKALEIAITHFSRPGVFANEVHAPLVYPGQRHIPYASTSGAAAAHTLTATSASKARNLSGLKCSAAPRWV